MATFPCDNPCPVCAPGPGGGVGPVDPANPFINLSSEPPDVDEFFGRRYTPGGPYWTPPLGTWYAVGCIGFCVSRISQEDADLCAQRQQVLCTSPNWPQPNPQWPNNPDVPPVEPRDVFYNQPQIATFQCPDGTPYSFTVAAGIFSSFSQLAANEMAYSYALNQGRSQRVCLGALSPARGCSGSVYSGSITSTGFGRTAFAISSGALPDGLLLSQSNTTLFIDGTPTTPGDYLFSVTGTNINNVSQTKSYSLTVFGISTPSPLPDAQVGQPYSEILSYAGTPAGAVTWAVTSGSLPSGLILNSSTGEISGTPDFDGVQGFTVSVNDTVLTCSKAFTMTVTAEEGFPNYAYTGLFGNSDALQSAFVNQYDFANTAIPDGTLLGNDIEVLWTPIVPDPFHPGYAIVFQGDATAGAGDAGTYRITVNNLVLVPMTTINTPQVIISLNSVAQLTYDLSTTTGAQFVDLVVVPGDIITYLFAVDGVETAQNNYQTTVTSVKLP